MKQVTQRLRDGRIEVRNVPPPELDENSVLVRVHASLLSAGTERAKAHSARQTLIGKARSRPDQVQQVLDKARREGWRRTISAVRTRLDQPGQLGYSAAGVALAVGDNVHGIAPGDNVACAGEGAAHAEITRVPGNLCVRMPDSVDFRHGAFATLGSIALHGVRQADVRLGERVAVIGLGLVGQLCGQLVRAAGATAIGIDLSREMVESATSNCAVDHGFERAKLRAGYLPELAADCDAVIIAASTKESDPVEIAARLCRDRGRVVVVGAVGMTLPRPSYYEKELDLRLSRSYGPGRYDREYEERGLDYPIGYVRWTERRNMRAFLDLIASNSVDVEPLISQSLSVEEAPQAYDRLVDGSCSPLGIILEYQHDTFLAPDSTTTARVQAQYRPSSNLGLGMIGAGSFAQGTLIPSLTAAGFELVVVASDKGLSADAAAARFGFKRSVSPGQVSADPDVSVVAIATRHASHASLVLSALEVGRAVFVEKPPCLTEEELDRLRTVRNDATRPLVVGFNRRHAPLVRLLRDQVAERDLPLELLLRVNAGTLAPSHWLNDPCEGGGRLLGEGCHFIDLACWLIGSLPRTVVCNASPPSNGPVAASQRFSVSLSFADGSIATILYGDGGAQRLGKELIEAHWGGRSAVLNDFRTLTVYEGRKRQRIRKRHRDKGYVAQAAALRALLEEGRREPLDLDPLGSMGVTLAALRSAEAGGVVSGTEIDQVE